MEIVKGFNTHILLISRQPHRETRQDGKASILCLLDKKQKGQERQAGARQ
jgi:hypothetical protein